MTSRARSATSGPRSRAETMADRVTIRSYRRVFEVDRRIYRVDRWPLPVPGGVPLRAVGYFAAVLVLMVALGGLVSFLSPPLRFVVVPLAVAVLGTQAAPDGRTAHRFAVDRLRFKLRAHRRSAGRVGALRGGPGPWGWGGRGRGGAGALGRRAGGPLGWRRCRAARGSSPRAGAGDVQRGDD